MKQLDVLAIGAHPDDVELGCGGSLADLAERGYRVGILDLTEAALSTRGDLPTRRREARRAAEALGVKDRHQLGLQESTLLSNPQAMVKLVDFLRSIRPFLVLCPNLEARHPDHYDAALLVQRAAFWAGVAKWGTPALVGQGTAPASIGRVTYRPHRILNYFLHRVEDYSFIVDVSRQFEKKLNALRAYASQFDFSLIDQKPTTHNPQLKTLIGRPEFIRSLVERARYFGSLIGVEYGEPFYTGDPLREEDLLEWAKRQGAVG